MYTGAGPECVQWELLEPPYFDNFFRHSTMSNISFSCGFWPKRWKLSDNYPKSAHNEPFYENLASIMEHAFKNKRYHVHADRII